MITLSPLFTLPSVAFPSLNVDANAIPTLIQKGLEDRIIELEKERDALLLIIERQKQELEESVHAWNSTCNILHKELEKTR